MRPLALLFCASCLTRPHPRVQGDGGGPGSDDASGTIDGPPQQNHVFVTSGVMSQPWDLGLATEFCGSQAGQAGLLGNFVPWLSYDIGAGDNAITRLRSEPNALRWHLTNGDLFATTPDDLITLPHALALKFDQFGQDVTIADPMAQVATGTAASGVYSGGTPANCTAGKIEIGYAANTDASWTEGGYQLCSSASLRLYCFSFGGTAP